MRIPRASRSSASSTSRSPSPASTRPSRAAPSAWSADTIAGIGAVSLLAGVLTWLVVQKPVRRLVRGTRRVAAGDLEAKIPVESRDELGVLAQSFNQMTEDLRHAHEEVSDWTRQLETRVEEKTAELKKVHQQMLHVERMTSIGKLAAIVAHEINNPLAGIHTYARLLMKQADRGDLDPKAGEGESGDDRVRVRPVRRDRERTPPVLPPQPQDRDAARAT